MKKKSLRSLLLILILMCSFVWTKAQERVYMPYFEVLNMHPDYQYSTSKLLKTYVDNKNKYLLILPEKADSSIIRSFEKTKQKAAEQNCAFFVRGDLNRLGDVVIVTISLYNTSDGKKLWQSILKANSPDDLDPIMEKLATNMGGTSFDENSSIYNVTNYDSRELNKIGSNRYFGFTIGGGFALANNVSSNSPAGFGLCGTYDSRNLIFNLKGEMYFSDINLYFFSIDAQYPLSTLKNTPFLEGGMGYGGATIYPKAYESKENSGLLIFLGGGYLFNRNSDVMLRFSGNFFVPSFKVGNSYPAGFMLTTTLLFGR